MIKIGKLFILNEAEMDELYYDIEHFRKYKIMAEIDWEQEQEHETNTQTNL